MSDIEHEPVVYVGDQVVPQLIWDRAAMFDELVDAIKSGHAWIKTWAAHIVPCRGAGACTCGKVAIESEMRTAFNKAEKLK